MNWRRVGRAIARDVVRRGVSSVVVAGAAAVRVRRTRTELPISPRSVLIIRLDLLGDLLFSMPVVQGVRAAYPDARIVMLTLPYVADVARLYPDVDEVLSVDTNRIRSVRGLLDPRVWREFLRAARRLRAERFDLAIPVNGRTASLCALLSGAHYIIGYADDSYGFTLDQQVPGGRYRERKHEVEYGRRLALAAGAHDPPDRLTLPLDPGTTELVQAMLVSRSVTARQRLVLIHAGSVNGSAKRWPVPCWVAFVNTIRANEQVRVGIIGSAADGPLAEHIQHAASAPVLDFTGATTLPELVSLIDRADLLVTGDSGPMHVAVALGRPVVSIFGPTDPAIYGPYHPSAPAIVLRANLPCSPCYNATAVAECPLGDPICMRLVTVDRVVESAQQILEQT